MENSPLGKLPGELRNRIYRDLLVEEYPLVPDLHYCCFARRYPGTWKDPTIEVPGFLATCKQIRAEALPIFFAENDFLIEMCAIEGLDNFKLRKERYALNIGRWLEQLGGAARHIQHVSVRLESCSVRSRMKHMAVIPSLLRFLEEAFQATNTKAEVKWRLTWTPYTPASGKKECCRHFEVAFKDPESAREAFATAFQDEAEMIKGSFSSNAGHPDPKDRQDSDEESRKNDLKESRRAIDEFLEDFETAWSGHSSQRQYWGGPMRLW